MTDLFQCFQPFIYRGEIIAKDVVSVGADPAVIAGGTAHWRPLVLRAFTPDPAPAKSVKKD